MPIGVYDHSNRRHPRIEKICPICNKKFSIIKRRENTAITCSRLCHNTRIARVYVRSGSEHYNWKGGCTRYYKKIAKNLPQVCNRCGSIEKLIVHHKDHNRRNNVIENLEILCYRCHNNHHGHLDKRDKLGRFIH